MLVFEAILIFQWNSKWAQIVNFRPINKSKKIAQRFFMIFLSNTTIWAARSVLPGMKTSKLTFFYMWTKYSTGARTPKMFSESKSRVNSLPLQYRGCFHNVQIGGSTWEWPEAFSGPKILATWKKIVSSNITRFPYRSPSLNLDILKWQINVD